jgi:spermidine synthase
MGTYGSVEAALAAYHDPWWQFTAWKVGVTFLLMVIPTFCMGASFPLANRLYVRDLRGVVRGVGALYAGNTVGSIVGSFAASFLLIPWLGVRDAAVIMAVLNLAGAALLLSRRDGRWRAGSAVSGWGLTLLAGLLALLLIPPTVFHPIYASAEKDKSLIHVDETVAGTVTIHETPGGFRVIDINGLNVAGTKFGFHCTQKLQAHFPLLMHPRPRNVMQIGFGTGGTCWSVSLHPEVERIDCVEINPGVIAAAPHFEEINHGIYKPGKDPRVTVTIEDARNFVLTTPHRYDVILSDSIHPRFTGNGLLYTRDYFEICAQVLEEDGIFSTWLPTAFLGDDEFRMIVRTLQSVFPHVLIWYMNNTVEGYTIAMGSRRPFAVDFDRLAERIARPALREDLATVHLENVYDLLDCIILGGANVVSYLGEGLLNTEDRPLIEFRAPRNMNRVVTEYRNLERLLRFRNFPEAMMGGWSADPDTATARRATFLQYFRATGLLLRGHQAHLMGRFPEEQGFYEQALAVNPADRDAVYLTERLERQQHGEMLDY